MGTRRYRTVKQCLSCGQDYKTQNPMAKYCSSKCCDKERYKRDRAKRLAAAKQYRVDNQSEISKRRKKEYDANKDRHRIANKIRYQKDRERRLKYAKRYQQNNPHVVAATRLNRASGKKYAVSGRDLIRIICRQRNECYYCGIKMTKEGRALPTSLQWEHIIPKSRGGAHSIGNIVAACRSCNFDKGTMFVMEWKRFKIFSQDLTD